MSRIPRRRLGGKWDRLPPKATSLLFDGLTLVGLALVGWRFGRARLAATLTFAWVAYPFDIRHELQLERHDSARYPRLGVLLSTSAAARGSSSALRRGRSSPRSCSCRCGPRIRTASSGRVHSCCSQWGSWSPPCSASGYCCSSRTGPRCTGFLGPFGWQLGRDSPFSAWNWAEYGYPDLHVLQTALKGLLLVGAIVLGFVPAEVAAPARRAYRRGPDRVRDRADALVLPLHPVVPALRGLCAVRPGAPARRADVRAAE